MNEDHVLDNVVWRALKGPRRTLGVSTTHAARFHPDVSKFAALCDDPHNEAWDELAALIGPGQPTTLFRPPLDAPPGWTAVNRIPCVQMVAGDVAAVDDERLVPLGCDDVADMLSLVAETKPGPFGRRTVEFGGYVGVRDNGRLVAMAGERFRCDGYTEISAVCTAGSHQGRGHGTVLVLALVHRIRARGEEAFLHASVENETAIRLYRALGFVVRCEVDAFVARAPR